MLLRFVSLTNKVINKDPYDSQTQNMTRIRKVMTKSFLP